MDKRLCAPSVEWMRLLGRPRMFLLRPNFLQICGPGGFSFDGIRPIPVSDWLIKRTLNVRAEPHAATGRVRSRMKCWSAVDWRSGSVRAICYAAYASGASFAKVNQNASAEAAPTPAIETIET